METIKHAAVKSIDGLIFMGKSHADCFHKAHHISIKMSQKAEDQGFMTNLGRFVQRGKAAFIAYKASQTEVPHSLLFSENLWSPTDGGIHDYDPVEGYVLKSGCEK